MEATTITASRVCDMRQRCEDLRLDISWQAFSHRYFQKSSSWFYHKFHGRDGNGGQGGFTPEEIEQFRGGLYDLSARIRAIADQLS